MQCHLLIAAFNLATGLPVMWAQLPVRCTLVQTVHPPRPSPTQEVEPHLNLRPFLNRAPMAVRLDTPATRVHSMLLSLSLRWDAAAVGWAGQADAAAAGRCIPSCSLATAQHSRS